MGERVVNEVGADEAGAAGDEQMPVVTLDSIRLSRALRILQREPQLLRQRIDGRAAALPGAFGLEPQVADAAAPRRDHAADGAEVGAIGVLLIEPADRRRARRG